MSAINDMVTEHEFNGRKDLCDERFSRDKTRIGEVEEALKGLTVLVTQLAEIIKVNAVNQADHEARLRVIESKGGRWLDKIIAAIIATVVSAAIAYFIGKGGQP